MWLVSPRTRLLQRFSAFPEGMRFLVDMRAEILPLLKADKRLLPLDAEQLDGSAGSRLPSGPSNCPGLS